jgi:hypothetical protein
MILTSLALIVPAALPQQPEHTPVAAEALEAVIVVDETDRPMLGVYLGAGGEEAGAMVDGVIDGSPAADAGFEAGDLIFRVGKTKVASNEELIAAIAACEADRRITIRVKRDGEVLRLKTQLAPRSMVLLEEESSHKGIIDLDLGQGFGFSSFDDSDGVKSEAMIEIHVGNEDGEMQRFAYRLGGDGEELSEENQERIRQIIHERIGSHEGGEHSELSERIMRRLNVPRSDTGGEHRVRLLEPRIRIMRKSSGEDEGREIEVEVRVEQDVDHEFGVFHVRQERNDHGVDGEIHEHIQEILHEHDGHEFGITYDLMEGEGPHEVHRFRRDTLHRIDDHRSGEEHGEDVDYWESEDGSERRLMIRMDGDGFPLERIRELMHEHGIEVDEMHFGSESGEHEFKICICGEGGGFEDHQIEILIDHEEGEGPHEVHRTHGETLHFFDDESHGDHDDGGARGDHWIWIGDDGDVRFGDDDQGRFSYQWAERGERARGRRFEPRAEGRFSGRQGRNGGRQGGQFGPRGDWERGRNSKDRRGGERSGPRDRGNRMNWSEDDGERDGRGHRSDEEGGRAEVERMRVEIEHLRREIAELERVIEHVREAGGLR